MAEIKITIPDEHLQRIQRGIAGRFRYRELIDGKPNPQTREDFFLEWVGKMIERTVIEYEKVQVSRAAAAVAVGTVEENIVLTVANAVVTPLEGVK